MTNLGLHRRCLARALFAYWKLVWRPLAARIFTVGNLAEQDAEIEKQAGLDPEELLQLWAVHVEYFQTRLDALGERDKASPQGRFFETVIRDLAALIKEGRTHRNVSGIARPPTATGTRAKELLRLAASLRPHDEATRLHVECCRRNLIALQAAEGDHPAGAAYTLWASLFEAGVRGRARPATALAEIDAVEQELRVLQRRLEAAAAGGVGWQPVPEHHDQIVPYVLSHLIGEGHLKFLMLPESHNMKLNSLRDAQVLEGALASGRATRYCREQPGYREQETEWGNSLTRTELRDRCAKVLAFATSIAQGTLGNYGKATREAGRARLESALRNDALEVVGIDFRKAARHDIDDFLDTDKFAIFSGGDAHVLQAVVMTPTPLWVSDWSREGDRYRHYPQVPDDELPGIYDLLTAAGARGPCAMLLHDEMLDGCMEDDAPSNAPVFDPPLPRLAFLDYHLSHGWAGIDMPMDDHHRATLLVPAALFPVLQRLSDKIGPRTHLLAPLPVADGPLLRDVILGPGWRLDNLDEEASWR